MDTNDLLHHYRLQSRNGAAETRQAVGNMILIARSGGWPEEQIAALEEKKKLIAQIESAVNNVSAKPT